MTASEKVKCPLCHTENAGLSMTAVGGGATWRCARCTQQWDSRRLATVAAYRRWSVATGRDTSDATT